MNPKELNEIAKRLKSLRLERQLSLQDLADRTGLTKSTLQRYETGNIGNIPLSKIDILAKGLNVNPHTILGWEEKTNPFLPDLSNISGILPVPHGKRIPVVGTIACGTPILAAENIDGYVEVNADDKADFALICKGDSMLPRLMDRDVVLIHQQPTVENGETAAVLIGEEATLKRVYFHGEDQIVLSPENPAFPPIVLNKEEINTAKILGKVIGYIRYF